MLAFPQLVTGALMQYPAQSEESRRTVLVQTAGGYIQRHSDTHEAWVRWRLNLRNLSDEEASAIGKLFEDAMGRLRTFYFIDPTANMFKTSENLNGAAWQKDPLLDVAMGAGTRAWASHIISNSAQVPQTVWQEFAAPEAFSYTVSALLRTQAPTLVSVGVWSATDQVLGHSRCGPGWTRVTVSGSPGGAGTEVKAGLIIPAGASVEAAEIQLMPQIGASVYIPGTSRSAVYPETRFDQDQLDVIATGVSNHSAVVRLISKSEL